MSGYNPFRKYRGKYRAATYLQIVRLRPKVLTRLQLLRDARCTTDGRGADLRMARVAIYTTMLCPYCWRAKKLLEEHGATYNEVDVMVDGSLRSEMRQRAGGRTSVPQIFINGQHVGGCDELYALERAGKLKPMLEQPAS